MLYPSVSTAMAEIEDSAPLFCLIDRYARLSRQYELEGRHAASAACDVICLELQGLIERLQEINGSEMPA